MPDRAPLPYTIISFAPVQGFIEQSRKLRDLYGSSLILSYLTYFLLDQIQKAPNLGPNAIISPGLLSTPAPSTPLHLEEQEGLTNRIILRGELERSTARHWLTQAWAKLLDACRLWIETDAIPAQNLTGEQEYYWGYHWDRWKYNAWEVFWGKGDTIAAADKDLQRRKLRRDWIGMNWMGESSSLTGTDAVAWSQLGRSFSDQMDPNEGDSSPHTVRSWGSLNPTNLNNFYTHLSWILDKPDDRVKRPFPSAEELAQSPVEERGRFLSAEERLSIPELVKRLVTLSEIAERLKMQSLDDGFQDLHREAGYWTGWFMGDGDRVGQMLQDLSQDATKTDATLTDFTRVIRKAGLAFKQNQSLFTSCPGRIIYSGGDDLFGVLYSPKSRQSQAAPTPLTSHQAYQWLLQLPQAWEPLQTKLKQDFDQDLTYSVGFVWAGHQVPQRDLLHHCREAEQAAKRTGRDRVAIRVVFNNGQQLQWTCPWLYLGILMQYRDRDGKSGAEQPNWVHLYQDWADLKTRHAITAKVPRTDPARRQSVDPTLALALFDLYFGPLPSPNLVAVNLEDLTPGSTTAQRLTGTEQATAADVVDWLDDLINVGWQLCSNS